MLSARLQPTERGEEESKWPRRIFFFSRFLTRKIWDTLGRSSTLSFFQSSSLSRWKDISHPADTREKKRGCTPLYSLKKPFFTFSQLCVLGVVGKYGTCCTQCLVVGEYNRHKYMTGKKEEETPQFSDVTPLSTHDGNDVAAAVDPFSWPLFVAFAKCSASVSISIVLLLAFSNFMAPSTCVSRKEFWRRI